jgi:hypothetical protein
VKRRTILFARKLSLPQLLMATLPIFIAFTQPLANQPDIFLSKIVREYSDKQPFGNMAGIYFDNQKQEIYVTDRQNHQIGITNTQGATLWTFKHWVTEKGSERRILGDPTSIVVTKSSDIIISDNMVDYLDVLDYRGVGYSMINPTDYDSVISFTGAVLAIDTSGNLYVGTKGNKPEILKFDRDLNLVKRFGDKGDSLDKFNTISGICLLETGEIIVTDLFSVPVVKIFDADGKYLRGFGQHDVEKTDFSFAAGVVSMRGGRIWIVDTIRQVVKCFDQNGEYITMIGGYGFGPGDMCYPSAISSDGDTLLLVAEREGKRYQQFNIH